jgi:sulfur carrier protein
MPGRRRGGLRGDPAVPVITVQINGKDVNLVGPTPLLAYLDRLGVDPRAVAVEYNAAIVERVDYPSVLLDEGDVLEIVRMVGGGTSATVAPV